MPDGRLDRTRRAYRPDDFGAFLAAQRRRVRGFMGRLTLAQHRRALLRTDPQTTTETRGHVEGLSGRKGPALS